jgi:hypothetical protein
MRAAVKSSPQALVYLDDKLKGIANSMLPTTTGFEFETSISTKAVTELHKDLIEKGGIKHEDIDVDDEEQRFMIANGIEGMIQLKNTLAVLKEHLAHDDSSNIHIHVYVKRGYQQALGAYLTSWKFDRHDNFILKELDKYKYKGSYNDREVYYNCGQHCWVRRNNSGTTMEFRIFKSTFVYEELIEIILHLHRIMAKVYAILDEMKKSHKKKLALEYKSHKAWEARKKAEKRKKEEKLKTQEALKRIIHESVMRYNVTAAITFPNAVT